MTNALKLSIIRQINFATENATKAEILSPKKPTMARMRWEKFKKPAKNFAGAEIHLNFLRSISRADDLNAAKIRRGNFRYCVAPSLRSAAGGYFQMDDGRRCHWHFLPIFRTFRTAREYSTPCAQRIGNSSNGFPTRCPHFSPLQIVLHYLRSREDSIYDEIAMICHRDYLPNPEQFA